MMQDLRAEVASAFTDLLRTWAEAVPRMLAVSALLIVALVVSLLTARLVAALLRRVRTDQALERWGVTESLRSLGVSSEPSRWASRLVFLVLLILLGRTVADSAGLDAVSAAIGTLLAYVPHLLAAAVVLLGGGVLARLTGAWVRTAAGAAGLQFAPALGRATGGFVFALLALMAVDQLQLETDIVRVVAVTVVAGAVLALALAFGLGSQAVTRELLVGIYARRMFRPGDEVEVEGARGSVHALMPTHLVLRDDEGEVVVPNSRLLHAPARRSR
ncbi:MAG: hypothetical protein D6701_05395 [Gemmatimonadetes bacterium]|nr:MAG: hypothetical protein D6701_05395 [Gemmatimonadota bacterium]